MVTDASTQTELRDLLVNLIELEYDMRASFEAAVARLESASYKEPMRAFLTDQDQHICDLKALAQPLCESLPQGPDLRQIVMKGTLMLAHLAGDRAILQALTGSLDAMNAAYERAVTHAWVTPEALGVMQRHFKDERRHRTWLTHKIHPEATQEAAGDGSFNPAYFDLNNREPVQSIRPRATPSVRSPRALKVCSA